MSGQYTEGVAGEQAALDYLRQKGMVLLKRRFRAADGEIDLILRDGETIVFVEVKARPTGRRGDGLYAVTPAKRRRMVHAAKVYLVSRDALDAPVRFDIVEITCEGLLHVPNAFWAD
ncbi:MAG: YraN family protein [Clostridia bacterium]|nr:YraN family protein [Clostridia bacterium]